MSDTQGGSRPLDRVFEALRSVHRRRVLLLLGDGRHGSAEALSHAEVVPDGVETARYMVGLIHTHLPKLAELGYIDWNREDRSIRHGPQFDEVAPVLSVLTDNRDRLPGDLV